MRSWSWGGSTEDGAALPVTNLLGLAALIFAVGTVLAGIGWLCWQYYWARLLAAALVTWGCVSFYNARFANCGDDGAWWGPCQRTTAKQGTATTSTPSQSNQPPGSPPKITWDELKPDLLFPYGK